MGLLKAPTAGKLLELTLAQPDLPEKIRALSPGKLASLINTVGLEDCGEIVALATSDQIERVFDDDLWRAARAGADESFDPDRLGLWIEVLLELGAAQAADKFAAMDPDFVTLAVSRLVWVTEAGWLHLQLKAGDGVEKIMDSTHAYELEGFVIFSRLPRAWDAILTLLVELDRDHHSFLHGVLERCSRMTIERSGEEGGLRSVLTSEKQIEEDVAQEREARRKEAGYVAPAEARAFLKLAAGPLDAEDHLSPAALRAPARREVVPAGQGPAGSDRSVIKSTGGRFARVQAMVNRDQTNRMEELNYLANVLVAGGNLNGRPPRPAEAARLALEACEKGLRRKRRSATLLDAFRAGWSKP